ncbi:phenylacetic acid degradation protein paaN [Agrobacterium vitis]|nr:phenylacetic acid degradation protein paaN [Agrobacterium vitis]
MTQLFDRHQAILDLALQALTKRDYWSPYPEIPSGKIYGESAKADGLAAFEARLSKPFVLKGHPSEYTVGQEVSPYGLGLNVTYPAASAESLVSASEKAGHAWAAATPQTRVGICLEILARLNARSFEMANAVMHTTGQAFAMAFQAGGPHAQDRGLEAVAQAYAEMTRTPANAVWRKPQGGNTAIVMEKHWRIMPRGVSLVIGCNTFPTWNSYPGLFASLATGNTVIIKPHPQAILPLAMTVEIARTVLEEEGFPADIVLLAADQPDRQITSDLVTHRDVSIIDYTGSSQFGGWVRANAGSAQVYTEEAGVNSIVIGGTDDFAGMCTNLAFSLSLYSGQMCTTPQNIFVPRDGISTNEGHKSFSEVAAALVSAIDNLLADPARASGVCGAIANPATLERIATARVLGRVLRDSAPIEGAADARTATPLLVAIDADENQAYEREQFGPIVFVIAVNTVEDGIERAARIAEKAGAITGALYALDEAVIEMAAERFARAGVNVSVNLTGGIYVNQSAAFSDFHVTGLNPAGNASLTDAAFVANRFRTVMLRRPAA